MTKAKKNVSVKLNKKDLIGLIADKSKSSKADAERFLNSFVDAVSDSLKKGNSINLIGFLSLSVVSKAARNYINPKTKEVVKSPAKKAVKAKAGSKLQELVA